ncbi:MAG: serine/threonine-protein phosphatase, partial [Leptospiraceae bacterium]|nr:serine/threonine-protein phosphatase [Leptospiraceae bacterium]
GSMLVSLVLGLVEAKTGFVYYINAEHPFTVLYRDEQAQFLEQNSGYLKLGVSLADNFVQVSGFQMFSGDVLLNGSDGREDFLDSSQTVQNNAEAFLKIVTQAKGKLDKIIEILEKEYELTDDLSLMSIELSEGFQSPEEKWDANIMVNLHEIASDKNLSEILKQKYFEFESKFIQNPFYLKAILPLFLKTKMYEEAFQITIYAIENIPSDTELMFLCSFAARKLKKFGSRRTLLENLCSYCCRPSAIYNL